MIGISFHQITKLDGNLRICELSLFETKCKLSEKFAKVVGEDTNRGWSDKGVV